MKLNSTRQLISEFQAGKLRKPKTFEGYQEAFNRVIDYQASLKRPNPPTEVAIKRAQFVDKTYVWNQK